MARLPKPLKKRLRLWFYIPARLAEYSTDERIILFAAAWDLLRVHRSLARHGYNATYDAITARPPRLPKRMTRLSIDRISQIVDAAARWTIGLETTCLRRTIVLCWYLRSAGIACELASGMAHEPDGWKGHAWVEVDGVPIGNDKETADKYTVFRQQLSRRSTVENE